MSDKKIEISVIIPIYNEEKILRDSMSQLLDNLREMPMISEYELLLCENGSTDKTVCVAQELMQTYPEVRLERLGRASYGQALKHGIQVAYGHNFVIFNADFWDLDFMKCALGCLAENDIVIGSKNMPGADDRRPFQRRLITAGFNLCLRVLFGFRGTDTHGIKALRADCARFIVGQCLTDAEIFDTELVLRSQRANLRIVEIPVYVKEMRPTRYGLLERVPRTFKDLITLIRVLGVRRQG